MMSPNETGILLQKVYTCMSKNFDMQLINAYHQHLSPQSIDHLVQMEMKRLKDNYRAEEERYVAQMLAENPVQVERRCAPNSSESATPPPSIVSEQQRLQQQRSESCRKSRVNNKIKKAKTKFRHKYATNKLAQSTNVLQCLQGVIAQAEAQLLANGHNRVAIQRLRNIYGLQRRAASSATSEVIEVD